MIHPPRPLTATFELDASAPGRATRRLARRPGVMGAIALERTLAVRFDPRVLTLADVVWILEAMGLRVVTLAMTASTRRGPQPRGPIMPLDV